jgi:hypothetical protein
MAISQTHDKSEDIKAVSKKLKLTRTVAIPTDKMNLFKCIPIDDYKNWAIKHLLKNGKEIPRDKLVLVFYRSGTIVGKSGTYNVRR